MLKPRYLFTQDFSALRTGLLALPHRVRRFARGEFLWAPGEPFERVYFFESGLARTSVLGRTGEAARVIAWAGPGTMFPVVHGNRFEIESRIVAEAVSPVVTLEFSSSALEKHLRDSPEFAAATIDWYAKFVNLLLFSVTDVARAPALPALASTLLLLFRNEAGAALARADALEATQPELARLIGIDRASLVRALSTLRRSGAVATTRGRLELLDLEALARAARTP